ncbi:hypothetical protein J0H58_32220 [bacterium]|nr:hypothetical protein [bacterium]
MRILDAGLRQEVESLAFSPDGCTLAASAAFEQAVVHDLTGARPPVLIGNGRSPGETLLRFEPGGRVLAAVTVDGRTRFDRDRGTVLGVSPRDPHARGLVVGFDTTLNGDRLVTSQIELDRSRLCGWEPEGEGWGLRWSVECGDLSMPALSTDGLRVAHVAFAERGHSGPPRLFVYDARTGELVASRPFPYMALPEPRYRADGRQVVAVHEMMLVVWDPLMPGKPALVRNDSRRHFTAAAYHPSGRYLFTTSNDATVTVWDTDSWARVKRFDWDIGRLRSVAVSPDGLLAAAGSDRGRVVVWDVDV